MASVERSREDARVATEGRQRGTWGDIWMRTLGDSSYSVRKRGRVWSTFPDGSLQDSCPWGSGEGGCQEKQTLPGPHLLSAPGPSPYASCNGVSNGEAISPAQGSA